MSVPIKAHLMIVEILGEVGSTTGGTGVTGETGTFVPEATIENVGPSVSSQLNELRTAEKTHLIELVSTFENSQIVDIS